MPLNPTTMSKIGNRVCIDHGKGLYRSQKGIESQGWRQRAAEILLSMSRVTSLCHLVFSLKYWKLKDSTLCLLFSFLYVHFAIFNPFMSFDLISFDRVFTIVLISASYEEEASQI